jgi:hypothetical protein
MNLLDNGLESKRVGVMCNIESFSICVSAMYFAGIFDSVGKE